MECDKPNDTHTCHFCGTDVCNHGYEDASHTKRHFLSDCRPDLLATYTDGPM